MAEYIAVIDPDIHVELTALERKALTRFEKKHKQKAQGKRAATRKPTTLRLPKKKQSSITFDLTSIKLPPNQNTPMNNTPEPESLIATPSAQNS